jgi:hypothetical protein
VPLSTSTKFVFTTPTDPTYTGYIAIKPWAMVVNDTACGYATAINTTGTTVGAGVIGSIIADSPLSTVEITGGTGADYYKYRLVSCVAEITYIGPANTRNGIITTVFAHSGYSLFGANLNGLKSSRHAQSFPVSDRTVVLTMNPTSDGVTDPYEWKTSFPNSECGIIMVDGSAESGGFQVEIFANFELIPPLTVTGGITGDMGLTKRYSDPAAISMAERASGEPSAFDRVGEYARRMATFMRWGMEFARGYAGPMVNAYPRIEL